MHFLLILILCLGIGALLSWWLVPYVTYLMMLGGLPESRREAVEVMDGYDWAFGCITLFALFLILGIVLALLITLVVAGHG